MPDTDVTDVYFAQGEQLVAVRRPAASIDAALVALLGGPTEAETGAGMKTHLPRGTRLRGVEVRRGVAAVDLGSGFLVGKDEEAATARLAQVVYTATAVPGVRGVRVTIEGEPLPGRLPGLAAGRALSRAALERPLALPRTLAKTGSATASAATRTLQQRLVALGFLRPGGVDGIAGEETRFAVIAFQKWAGLRRDGGVGTATEQALAAAVRPKPRRRGSGRRIEVLLDRQLALLIDGATVVRTIHVSTGRPGTRTPVGSFSVFRKEKRSWSVPFRVWLPWASYFVGGIAFHEYPIVPTTPASHGCVRVPRYDARRVYEFATRGTPVRVIASS